MRQKFKFPSRRERQKAANAAYAAMRINGASRIDAIAYCQDVFYCYPQVEMASDLNRKAPCSKAAARGHGGRGKYCGRNTHARGIGKTFNQRSYDTLTKQERRMAERKIYHADDLPKWIKL